MPLPRPSAVSHLQRAMSVKVEPYNYYLPHSLIAEHPLVNRASSKLLSVTSDLSISHQTFSDLPSLLPAESLVVLNTSKVIPARIPVRKSSGGRAEVLLLEPVRGLPSRALQKPASGQIWRAFIGGKRVRENEVLSTSDGGLSATVLDKSRSSATVRLDSSNGLSLSGILSQFGRTPLPPYIKREPAKEDVDSYQTVYANISGSVAAPTAGLHITDEVLGDFQKRGIRTREIILHVGAGTFQPVSAEDVGGHDMHEETVAVTGETIAELISQVERGAPLVSVGTTTVRTLESLYWFGVRLLLDQGMPEVFAVEQWEPYERLDDNDSLPSTEEALSAVMEWGGGLSGQVYGRTRLLIVPGYPFKLIDALVTNFHTPKSTLLLLVSAFIGGGPQSLFGIYNQAIESKYRFLSYGDSSVYFRDTMVK